MARISLALFAQVFSFFLHLYRASQTEIKYFQNELTTLQSRFLALYTALLWDEKDSYRSILIETARIERNFVLKKDETTPEIEKLRCEKDSILEMYRALTEAIKAKSF